MTSYEYDAELVRVIDGDTVVLKVDCGFRLTFEDSFRLYGIDTPELHGVSAEVREKALAAKAEVERLCGLGKLRIETYKPDKYGRWLATIFVRAGSAEININEKLVADGFAEEYMVKK